MNKAILFLILTHAAVVLADSPAAKPESYEKFSPDKKCVADVDLKKKLIVVFSVDADGNRTELWRMPGWFRWIKLANDGQYLAIPSAGMNLINLNYKKDDVLLTLVKNGKVARVVKLNEVINDFAKLQRTVSHFSWGMHLGFNEDNEFILQTVEHNWFFINPDTGKIRKEKAPIPDW